MLSLLALTVLAGSSVRPLALVHANVIDVEAMTVRRDQTLLIRGDRIERIAPSASLAVPQGALRIDAKGAYALPGLWDLHVHLQSVEIQTLPQFLGYGVTTVRDMGTAMSKIKAMRRALLDGRAVGPRIFAAGSMIESPTIYGLVKREIADKGDPFEMERRLSAGNAEEGRAAVRAIAASGADFVKVHSIANQATYEAIVQEAAERGLPVYGHDPMAGILPDRALRSGQRSIEHLEGLWPYAYLRFSDAQKSAFANLAQESRAAFVPTLGLLSTLERVQKESTVEGRIRLCAESPEGRRAPPILLQAWRHFLGALPQLPPPSAWDAGLQALRDLHKRSVPILAGTDLGVPLVLPGLGLRQELTALVGKVGLSPIEALRAGTWYSARLMDQGSESGLLKPGYRADVVLFRRNPAFDLKHLQSIGGVIQSGRYYTEPELAAFRGDP